MDAFCPLLVFHIHVHEKAADLQHLRHKGIQHNADQHRHNNGVAGKPLEFYLFHKAQYEEDPARKEFARAYLFYKLVFFIAGAVVLLILIWIGLGLLDQLLAYMEML